MATSRTSTYTKIFAMIILSLWILTYVVGYMFNRPNLFLYWNIFIITIGIAVGIWYAAVTVREYTQSEGDPL
ncbi:MAG: hypothetical protein QXV48_04195 [Desulfurococcaceae archaeon]